MFSQLRIDNGLLMALRLQNFCSQALWPEDKINIKIKPSSPQVKSNYHASPKITMTELKYGRTRELCLILVRIIWWRNYKHFNYT